MRSDRQVRKLLETEAGPSVVLAEVVNPLEVLKPSFRGEQFDDPLHRDDVRLVLRHTNDHRPPSTGGPSDDRDPIGGDERCSILGDG